MSDRPIIEVENLSKRYHLGGGAGGGGHGASYRTLRETLSEGARRLLPRRGRSATDADQAATATDSTEFWALKDVSFQVAPGEVVGIIGRNGAGKSTLLKILSRITEPTQGRVTLRGRVASLLEVGTGFHTELTGRENIFLNGSILGMARTEIRAKFDEIVAFAEVERFLDTPVKRYSSGMYVRLAFAVAAHLEPEILIVDEVLAVGDAEFQKKCLGKMESVAKGEGRTVLFVSHQMNAVQNLCQSCLLLREGKLVMAGPSAEVLAEYLRSGSQSSRWDEAESDLRMTSPYFRLKHFAVIDPATRRPLQRYARGDESLEVVIEGEIEVNDSSLNLGVAVYTAAENVLLFWSVQTDKPCEEWPRLKVGKNRLVVSLPYHFLNEGDYRIEFIASLHQRIWIYQPEVNAPGISLKIKGGLSESPHWMEARPGLLAPLLNFVTLEI